MLLHADIVVASQNSKFSLPFTSLGLVPEAGSSFLLPRMVGHHHQHGQGVDPMGDADVERMNGELSRVEAVHAGRARGMDIVMVDTAGRLPTQLHLMDELKKIRRVIAKADPTAPHEVLLVVDGNSGQNVLSQIRSFDAAVGLTGLIVTKLDGTAKGGTLAAVAAGSQGTRPVPVYWIGVGEKMEDLQPFDADAFVDGVLGL